MERTIKQLIWLCLAILALFYLASCIFLTKNPLTQKCLVAGWFVLPPCWLFIEYRFLFDPKEESFEAFKHYQDLLRNIWFGFCLLLVYLFH